MDNNFKKLEKNCIEDVEDVIRYIINWADTNKKRRMIQDTYGIDRANLIGYRNGKKSINNMQFYTVKRLFNFYIEFLQEERFKEIAK